MNDAALLSPLPEGWVPFSAVPKFVYEKHLLKYTTASEWIVFHSLFRYRFNNTRVTVSLAALARTANMCRKTVIAATQGLEFLGLIAKHGTNASRVMQYELLPYGAELPPNIDEIVMQRAKPPRRRPPRNVNGRFRSQHVEGVVHETLTSPTGGLQDEEDPSTDSGLVRTSGGGHQSPLLTDTVEKPLELRET